MINENEAESLRELIRAMAVHLRRLGCVRDAFIQDGDDFLVWTQDNDESGGVYDFRFPEKGQTSTLNGETLMQAFYRNSASLRDVESVYDKDLPRLSDLVARFANVVLLSEITARQEVSTAKATLQERLADIFSRDPETLLAMPNYPSNCKRCATPLDKNGLCEDETCPHSEWKQDIDMDTDFDDEGKLKDPSKVRFRQWP